MTRLPPTTIARQRLGKTYHEIEVAKATGYFVVVYKGQAVNVIKHHYYTEDRKYYKTGFSAPGHAINLAKKLNRIFECEDFSVTQVM